MRVRFVLEILIKEKKIPTNNVEKLVTDIISILINKINSYLTKVNYFTCFDFKHKEINYF